MKDVQCYELFGGIALIIHAFLYIVISLADLLGNHIYDMTHLFI